jgi:hypothetical protein
VSDFEGDPDLSNDRSRVRISQRTKVDAAFGIEAFNIEYLKNGPADGDGAGAVVVSSDKVRIIARSDVEIIVQGFDRDTAGNMVSGTDTSRWAAIVVKSNGDIVFRPSDKGVVRLGGDDANLAVLCVQSPNGTTPEGSVSGAPITNNFGGVNGTGGQSGEWAKKVLLK